MQLHSQAGYVGEDVESILYKLLTVQYGCDTISEKLSFCVIALISFIFLWCMLLERKMVSEYQKKDIFWKKNRRRQGQWGSLCLSVGIIVITMKTGRMIDITSG
ncbi:hypothetical protein Tco_0785054, partial [Tanacetum coccineum]